MVLKNLDIDEIILELIDDSANIRREARKKLVEIGGDAVRPLLARLETGGQQVQLEIVKALGRLGDPRAVGPLIEALEDPDGSIGRWAGKSLARIGGASVEPLVCLSEAGDPGLRRVALSVLAEIGDERAVDPLEVQLGSRDAETRVLAAKALALTAVPRVIAPLAEALRDPHWPVRLWAAYGLGLTGRKRGTTGPLLEALRDDSPHVRAAAATALGDVGSLSAVGPLIGMLGDGDELIRLDAARALGKIGSREAVDPLTERLGDGDPYVRGFAARALGMIGAPEAVDPLLEALGDEEGVALEAVGALEEIGTGEAMEGLREFSEEVGDGVLRDEISEALGLSSGG